MAELITVDRARQALPAGMDEGDDRIAGLIGSASAAIERWCDRRFAGASYDETHTPTGGRFWLRQFPVTAISRIALGRSTALKVQNASTSANQRATVTIAATGLTLARIASGTVSSSTVTWASNPLVEDVAGTVGGVAGGWSAEMVAPFARWPATELVGSQGPIHCLGQWAEVRIFDEDLADYELDVETGEVSALSTRSVGRIRVQYSAGFASIPADVQEACAQLVAAWWHASQRDHTLRSEQLGDYQYQTTADALPAAVRLLLDPYRDRRIGL